MSDCICEREPCNRGTVRNLTERLAQAERERDEWREKANTTAAWGQAHGLNVTELTDERDAALAKAEAAEKTGYSEGYRDAMDSLGEPARALADLRARIEALADEWGERYGESPGFLIRAQELRALLQAAKPETALDFFNNMVRQNTPTGYEVSESDWAKLRKLLEEQK